MVGGLGWMVGGGDGLVGSELKCLAEYLNKVICDWI